jgi:AraC-like DNA-binding protein
MELSRSSKTEPDPLLNVLDVLGARVTRRTRMEAGGQWALAFPALNRLKFVTLLRGSQWMLLPGRAPQLLNEGDVCLLGRTEYTVASHPDLTPVDGKALFDSPGCDVAHIGGDDTIGIGGTVTFAHGSADFLLDMVPTFAIVPRFSPASGAIATILGLMSNEIERDVAGTDIVSARLADVLLVEAIRAYTGCIGQAEIGWLGALSDPRLSRALRAIHKDIAQPWTVARLAGVAGMSRAAFSAEFTRRTGKSPLAYLRTWRLTVARAALTRGDTTVAQVARDVGYTSQSAFGHAFRRAFGTPPKAVTRSTPNSA